MLCQHFETIFFIELLFLIVLIELLFYFNFQKLPVFLFMPFLHIKQCIYPCTDLNFSKYHQFK